MGTDSNMSLSTASENLRAPSFQEKQLKETLQPQIWNEAQDSERMHTVDFVYM